MRASERDPEVAEEHDASKPGDVDGQVRAVAALVPSGRLRDADLIPVVQRSHADPYLGRRPTDGHATLGPPVLVHPPSIAPGPDLRPLSVASAVR